MAVTMFGAIPPGAASNNSMGSRNTGRIRFGAIRIARVNSTLSYFEANNAREIKATKYPPAVSVLEMPTSEF